ncbi:hypothetical protein AGRA3207_001652 [Actinomadura graeca]|uniref:Lipoprotein n=1 Tax=Actinomadura graeca TaxID=2750812 RepID=A0ABX8QQF8_9ACTN|nr:hypothetical protein [Actinomadura graeca]QXJ20865.1 hypothetical protein AGRA3207_001652 [Actinomadura graeca]
MLRRVIACAMAGTAAAFSLTGCLGEENTATPQSAAPAGTTPAGTTPAGVAPAQTPSATTGGGAPAGWTTIGGPENGVRMSIPAGWMEIDLTSGEAEDGLKRLGLQGANENLLRQSFALLEQQKAVYAVETGSAQRGYATNVNALCTPSPASSVEALEMGTRQGMSQLGAQDVEITRTTVAGRPGIRTTYVLRSAAGVLTGRQVQVTDGGRACSLTVTAKEGEMPGDADQITNTLELL